MNEMRYDTIQNGFRFQRAFDFLSFPLVFIPSFLVYLFMSLRPGYEMDASDMILGVQMGNAIASDTVASLVIMGWRK